MHALPFVVALVLASSTQAADPNCSRVTSSRKVSLNLARTLDAAKPSSRVDLKIEIRTGVEVAALLKASRIQSALFDAGVKDVEIFSTNSMHTGESWVVAHITSYEQIGALKKAIRSHAKSADLAPLEREKIELVAEEKAEHLGYMVGGVTLGDGEIQLELVHLRDSKPLPKTMTYNKVRYRLVTRIIGAQG